MNAIQKPLIAPSQLLLDPEDQCLWIKREASKLEDVMGLGKKIRELPRDVSVSKIGMRNKCFVSMLD